jgi:hypothetical protein
MIANEGWAQKSRPWEEKMRTIFGALAMVIAVMTAQPAAAQWKEYLYPDLGIGKEWPAEPKREAGMYKSDVVGREAVPSVVLSVEKDNVAFRMEVVTLDTPELVARSASITNECIFNAEEQGVTLANMTNRVEGGVNAVYGRLTSVELFENKGRKQTTCLFTKGKMYIISAHVLPAHGEPNSSQAIRFTNSLRFRIDRPYGE